jgi:hypothetical protein
MAGNPLISNVCMLGVARSPGIPCLQNPSLFQAELQPVFIKIAYFIKKYAHDYIIKLSFKRAIKSGK